MRNCNVTGIIVLAAVASWGGGRIAAQEGRELVTTFTAGEHSLPYRLFIPSGSGKQPLPLVICLHGVGQRGTDNRGGGRARVTLISDAVQRKHPSFVLSPQCPKNDGWACNHSLRSYSIDGPPTKTMTAVLALLAEVRKRYSIDERRIYVTGQSMGGFGTWEMALRNPQLFAAAIPVCGGGDPSKAAAIAAMPLWVFHGGADPTVPVNDSREMVAALKKNPNLKYTEYPGVGHNAWDKAWDEPGIVEWLFAQQKGTATAAGSSSGAKADRNPRGAVTSSPPRSRSTRGQGDRETAGMDVQVYEARDFQGMPYRLMKPIDLDAKKSYPLILSLHGAGGKGTDNLRNLRMAWLAVLSHEDMRRKHPCFVVAPQTAKGWSMTGETMPALTEETIAGYPEAWQRFIKKWLLAADSPLRKAYADGELTKAFALVAAIEKEFPIDRQRVYVMGHSMGGVGTWNALYAKPEMFAAVIPTAGGLAPWKDATRFADVPIWAFHGSADPTVPVEFTRTLFEIMKKCGGNMKYTELKGVDHGCNAAAFNFRGDDAARGWITHCSSGRCDGESDVWEWLFQQKRK